MEKLFDRFTIKEKVRLLHLTKKEKTTCTVIASESVIPEKRRRGEDLKGVQPRCVCRDGGRRETNLTVTYGTLFTNFICVLSLLPPFSSFVITYIFSYSSLNFPFIVVE